MVPSRLRERACAGDACTATAPGQESGGDELARRSSFVPIPTEPMQCMLQGLAARRVCRPTKLGQERLAERKHANSARARRRGFLYQSSERCLGKWFEADRNARVRLIGAVVDNLAYASAERQTLGISTNSRIQPNIDVPIAHTSGAPSTRVSSPDRTTSDSTFFIERQ